MIRSSLLSGCICATNWRTSESRAVDLSEDLCMCADRHPDVFMPGYTHLQRAMPSTVAPWALGYAETPTDDLETLRAAR